MLTGLPRGPVLTGQTLSCVYFFFAPQQHFPISFFHSHQKRLFFVSFEIESKQLKVRCSKFSYIPYNEKLIEPTSSPRRPVQRPTTFRCFLRRARHFSSSLFKIATITSPRHKHVPPEKSHFFHEKFTCLIISPIFKRSATFKNILFPKKRNFSSDSLLYDITTLCVCVCGMMSLLRKMGWEKETFHQLPSGNLTIQQMSTQGDEGRR